MQNMVYILFMSLNFPTNTLVGIGPTGQAAIEPNLLYLSWNVSEETQIETLGKS